MSKRGADHQLTKDQDDSDDDRHGPVEVPKEASADVMATRKIAKPKSRKRPTSGVSSPGIFANLAAKPVSLPASTTQFTFGKPAVTANNDSDIHLKKRGLNKSFIDAVIKSVDNNPFGNLSPLFDEYRQHFSSIEKKPAEEQPTSNAVVSEVNPQQQKSQDSSSFVTEKPASSEKEDKEKPLVPPGAPRFGFSAPALGSSFQFNSSAFTPKGSFGEKSATEAEAKEKETSSNQTATGTAATTTNQFSFNTAANPFAFAKKENEESKPLTPVFSFSTTMASADASKEAKQTHETKDSKSEESKPSNNEKSENAVEPAKGNTMSFSWTPDKPIKFDTPEKKFTFTNPLSSKKLPASSDVKPPSAAAVGFSFGTTTNPFSFAAPKSSFPTSSTPASVGAEKSEETSNGNKSEQEEKENGNDETRSNDSLVSGKGKGEENEDSVFETRAKIYRFDATSKSYSDIGIGPLKINVDRDTGSARILARVEGSGKLLLNVRLCQDFEYSLAGKKDVKVPAASTDGKSIEMYLIRVKEPSTAEKLLAELNEKKVSKSEN
ncbi:Nucleoporin nup61 [Schizosaccharomyces pombe]